MRITREERFHLKLIRLAEEVSRRGDGEATIRFDPWTKFIKYSFYVSRKGSSEFIVYTNGIKTAKACYEWAVDECKKKGLIR